MDPRPALNWLWHVFNDPVNQNIWSMVVLIAVLAAGAFGIYLMLWGTKEMLKWRRKPMKSDGGQLDRDNYRAASEAINRARGQREPSPTDVPDFARGGVPRQAVEPSDSAEKAEEYLHARYEDDPLTGSMPAPDEPYFDDQPRPEDSGVHALPPTPRLVMQVACEECHGSGYVEMTVSDLLRESIGLIPDGGGDMVVKEFYTQLLALAPSLAPIFPADLLTAQTGDRSSAGFRQRDKLYEALAALSALYDPDDPEKMGRLKTAGEAFGRAHANFYRPDEDVTRGASLEEYKAVKDVLFATFGAVAGSAWKPAYTAAWSKAYDHLTGIMLIGQHSTTFTAPRFPRS